MEVSSQFEMQHPAWSRDAEGKGLLSAPERLPPPQQAAHRMTRTASMTLAFCVLVIILLTLLTLVLADNDFFASNDQDDILGLKAGSYPDPLVLADCGHSPSQARANGCIFDTMLAHWVSPLCFDEAIHDSYLEARSWSWFHDISFEHEAPRERVMKGDLPGTWITLEFHFFHCAYLWQLQMKAYTTGGPLVEYLWAYEHAAHCANAIAFQAIPGANVSYAKTGYTSIDSGWTPPPDE
ncbi:hypothetical protein LTR27_012090 [Elasticomyces elasticus]|nr:hypothetical protein LTR27_012090 [Elasticomyces elasticus]